MFKLPHQNAVFTIPMMKRSLKIVIRSCAPSLSLWNFFFTSSVFFTQFQVYARQPLLLSHFMAHKQLIVQFNCIFYGYEIV